MQLLLIQMRHADEGIVRLFITSESKDKEYIEKKVAEMMAQDTGDSWVE